LRSSLYLIPRFTMAHAGSSYNAPLKKFKYILTPLLTRFTFPDGLWGETDSGVHRLVFLGEQSGMHMAVFFIGTVFHGPVLTGSDHSWQDIAHYALHVRFVRQHVPGNHRNRFSLQGMHTPLVPHSHAPTRRTDAMLTLPATRPCILRIGQCGYSSGIRQAKNDSGVLYHHIYGTRALRWLFMTFQVSRDS